MYANMDGEWGPATWRHICLSFNSTTYMFLAVNNEQVVVNRTLDFSLSKPSKEFNRSATRICIMKNTGEKASLVGKLTDMNIFSYALDTDNMFAWTQCRERPSGDVVAWETAEWDEEGLFAD